MNISSVIREIISESVNFNHFYRNDENVANNRKSLLIIDFHFMHLSTKEKINVVLKNTKNNEVAIFYPTEPINANVAMSTFFKTY